MAAAACCRVLQAAPVPGFTALAKVGAALLQTAAHSPVLQYTSTRAKYHSTQFYVSVVFQQYLNISIIIHAAQ